jgi:predicted unusual protein kinase regulating ubiquinone biosynthesis (AarF/ABC1/UbiB family)
MHQVHHAIAHDGRELAVKIQYPTLRDEFSGDMFTHWLVLNIADMLFDRTHQRPRNVPSHSSAVNHKVLGSTDFDLAWMHDELEQNLVKELDFENEARNSERCARNFRYLFAVMRSLSPQEAKYSLSLMAQRQDEHLRAQGRVAAHYQASVDNGVHSWSEDQ